jgi:uncharacterized protein DUF3108
MSNWSWLRISALAWVSTIFAGAAWCAPPEHVELAYEITRNGTTIAEVFYLLEHDGRTYRITETSKGRGILALRGTTRRTSRGVVSAQGLRPVEFTDERSGRDTARANFDWETKTITLQYKGEPRSEPLPPRAHDRLAWLFDFAFAPHRREAAFDLFDGRGQSHHVYTPGGREHIKTRLGEFEALRFVRANGDERTEIWLASALSLLPLRILVVEKDGTRYEQLTTKITPP